MERRFHLPRFVADRLRREKDRQRADQLQRLRVTSLYDSQEVYAPGTRSASKRLEARRRGKRARYARCGKPTHNFRIYR